MVQIRSIILEFCLFKLMAASIAFNQLYTVSQVTVINMPGNALESSLKMVGRERVLNGTVTLLEDLSNDVKLSIQLYNDPQGNGEYMEMPMELSQFGLCDTLRAYYKRFVQSTVRSNVHTDFDFMDGNVCPFPKGKYWLKNVIFDSTEWVNILPQGNIKAQLLLHKDNKFVGGFAIVVNIVMKILI